MLSAFNLRWNRKWFEKANLGALLIRKHSSLVKLSLVFIFKCHNGIIILLCDTCRDVGNKLIFVVGIAKKNCKENRRDKQNC